MENTERFRDRLKSLREKNGLSQEEASILSGLGKQAFWRYESADTVPRASTIDQIANAFGVSAKWLLTGIESNALDDVAKELEIQDEDIAIPETTTYIPLADKAEPQTKSEAIVYSAADARKLSDVNECIAALRYISGIDSEKKHKLHALLSEIRTDLESKVLFGDREGRAYYNYCR